MMRFTYVIGAGNDDGRHTCYAATYDGAYAIIRSRHGLEPRQVSYLAGEPVNLCEEEIKPEEK